MPARGLTLLCEEVERAGEFLGEPLRHRQPHAPLDAGAADQRVHFAVPCDHLGLTILGHFDRLFNGRTLKILGYNRQRIPGNWKLMQGPLARVLHRRLRLSAAATREPRARLPARDARVHQPGHAEGPRLRHPRDALPRPVLPAARRRHAGRAPTRSDRAHGDAWLCDGWLECHEIECPLHQGRFDVRDGRPLCDPATQPLRRSPVRIEGGRVFLRLA